MEEKDFGKTKIIATIGPSSKEKDIVLNLMKQGVSVFRLNFSYGCHKEKATQIHLIRELERQIGRPVGILADLQGRKVRLGKFQDGEIDLQKGDVLTLDLDKTPGDRHRVMLPHKEIFDLVNQDDVVLVDDGKLSFKVTKVSPQEIHMKALHGGKVSDHKGLTIPGKTLPFSVLTPKDKEDLTFALDQEVDWIAVSYIQSKEDVLYVKKLINERAGLIAKVEHPGALEDLEAIISYATGIMVARGDLGLEINPEEVPSAQKRIVRACREAGKPVIVATQMLDSMIVSSTPTRAEVSDVATVVYEGADALMLSGETANGSWPLKAVEVMMRTILRTEKDPISLRIIRDLPLTSLPTISHAITRCVQIAAETVPLKGILAFTETGRTAQEVSRERPRAPILGLTPFPKIARQLTLVWGVSPVLVKKENTLSLLEKQGSLAAFQKGFCQKGDHLVLTAGSPSGVTGSTNLLKIITMRPEHCPQLN